MTGDPHDAGQAAARAALASVAPAAVLGYEGTRPIVVGGGIAISITHSRTRAFAVAARVDRIGIDIVDDADPRIVRIAPRYLERERAFARTPGELARCFAAKEAGLKALGLGLLDGGMFETCAVDVISLEPPRLATTSHPLSLVFSRAGSSTLAIAFG